MKHSSLPEKLRGDRKCLLIFDYNLRSHCCLDGSDPRHSHDESAKIAKKARLFEGLKEVHQLLRLHPDPWNQSMAFLLLPS